MGIGSLNKKDLITALNDMAKEWSQNRGLCHDFAQGARYGELQAVLKDKYGISAYIDTVDHHDDMQVIIEN